tara:strand:- start:130 stop:402 length:273 start_codon:yes stop_codon:yes gene_type:complete
MALPIAGMVFRGGKWVFKKTIKKKKNPKQLELDLKPKATKKKIHKSEDPWSATGYINPKVNPRKTKTYGPTKRKYHGKKERRYGNPNKGN